MCRLSWSRNLNIDRVWDNGAVRVVVEIDILNAKLGTDLSVKRLVTLGRGPGAKREL